MTHKASLPLKMDRKYTAFLFYFILFIYLFFFFRQAEVWTEVRNLAAICPLYHPERPVLLPHSLVWKHDSGREASTQQSSADCWQDHQVGSTLTGRDMQNGQWLEPEGLLLIALIQPIVNLSSCHLAGESGLPKKQRPTVWPTASSIRLSRPLSVT